MRALLGFSLGCLLALPLMASASGIVYFEFAPDAWASQRLAVSGAGTPYQLFQVPADITLTGFEFWVDNTSAASTVTFTLANDQGNTLATKSTALPALALLAGGYKLHVDLDTPITLTANTTYSIKIDSSASGFGLYYADRITYLEHNQQFTTPYSGGVARLNQNEQPYTFKFALFVPSPTPTTPPTPTPPPTPQSIIITNARVATTTSNSVTLAWTTNIAADSRATVRNQISPLYVTGSNYDSTFELEHVITVTGLNPDAGYFADMFSSQGDALLITTYSVSFRTPQGAAPSPNPSPNPTPNPSPSPNPSPNPSPSPTPNPSPSPSPNPNPSPSPNPTPNPNPSPSPIPPPVEIIPPGSGGGGGGGGTTIRWPASGSEPSGGYRIDIFDENYSLEKQLTIPAGTHSSEVSLPVGAHHAVVYAKNDDLYTKVAPIVSFLTSEAVTTQTSWPLIGLAIALAGGTAGYFYWTHKKKEVAPEEEPSLTSK